MWLHRFLRQAGGCIAVLGGLDALVITGGIGELSTEVQAMACDGLSWLGVTHRDVPRNPPDADQPDADLVDVSDPISEVRTFVVRAREDLQMIHEASAMRTL